MPSPDQERLRVVVRGAVQGVGFRPFVHRLAIQHALHGWVRNGPGGVEVEVEGRPETLSEFLVLLQQDAPPLAHITGVEPVWLDAAGLEGFEIRDSDKEGPPSTVVLPDIATCPECLAEIRDPDNRRHRYPFTNCTHCGPRFSIIQKLPYDRAHTTMAGFEMCDDCRREYEDPTNRRFHAQPNACPECGPHLAWWDADGHLDATQDDALLQAARALRGGLIVAVKGLGGFHLMVDAANADAVNNLRERKLRDEKPFALMVPSIEGALALCAMSPMEERLLTSPEAPIVLLHRRPSIPVCDEVAPDNPMLGIMLPYTPLHHLLLAEVDRPLVATSGNLSEEPICIHEEEALQQLGNIADAFLIHDRPIVRPVDDSVARVIVGREQVLRRSRGFAPLPIPMPHSVDGCLAVGGHMKNTVALGVGSNLFVSQHVGDLDTPGACRVFESAAADLQELYRKPATSIACDMHPDYRSTWFARASGLPVTSVQHHFAHIAACLAENDAAPPALGLAWDGTGYGMDATVWGGEAVVVTESGEWFRFGNLRSFGLPGGESAVREPWRCALGLLYEEFGDAIFEEDQWQRFLRIEPQDRQVLRQALNRGLNTPRTTSLGRLFDAVASLLDLRQTSSFEGQAAMAVEFAARRADPGHERYEVTMVGRPIRTLDWSSILKGIVRDLAEDIPVPEIAARFHRTLAAAAVAYAERARRERVVLSGGCFQNAYLTELTYDLLNRDGFQVLLHQRVPPNDGGLAVGQAAIAAAQHRQGM